MTKEIQRLEQQAFMEKMTQVIAHKMRNQLAALVPRVRTIAVRRVRFRPGLFRVERTVIRLVVVHGDGPIVIMSHDS